MASQLGVPAGPKETGQNRLQTLEGPCGEGDTSSAKAGDLKNLIKHPSPQPNTEHLPGGPLFSLVRTGYIYKKPEPKPQSRQNGFSRPWKPAPHR